MLSQNTFERLFLFFKAPIFQVVHIKAVKKSCPVVWGQFLLFEEKPFLIY